MSNSHMRTVQRPRLVAATIILGGALVLCSLIGGYTVIKAKGMGNSIRVTGAAFKPIRSDLAIWRGSLSVQAVLLEDAYDKLRKDMHKVRTFLKKSGFEEGQYETGVVGIRKLIDRNRVVTGYVLSQTVEVELNDVDKISQLAKEASGLIEYGVMMESQAPSYLFTGLDTLKIEMIRRATENAMLRAKQLAETTGRSVGAPSSASVGVFQIRPLHSQEVSSYGISDESSIDKEIVSTVHVSFLIE